MKYESTLILVGFLATTLVLGMGCKFSGQKNDCVKRLEGIAQMERQLVESAETIDVSLRNALMTAYADFSNFCHEADETPEFLFRRADLLRSAGYFQEAMTQLRDIHDHFKDFDKRPICAFLVGFIAEEELNDREQARKTYEQVIELHPESRAAEWASQSILNLDMPQD